jgi:ATP-dependent Lon protease
MELPSEVPVMTLPSATLFPQALLPLYIFEPRYQRMLADALKTDRMFTVAMQKPGRTRETPCGVAGLGLIRVSVDHRDGTSHLILQGLTRVELKETVQYKPYRVQCIQPLQAEPRDNVMIDALLAKVFELVKQRVDIGPFPLPFPMVKTPGSGSGNGGSMTSNFPVDDVLNYLESISDPDQVADLISCALLPNPTERQILLETVDVEARLKHLIHFLMAEIRRERKNGGS